MEFGSNKVKDKHTRLNRMLLKLLEQAKKPNRFAEHCVGVTGNSVDLPPDSPYLVYLLGNRYDMPHRDVTNMNSLLAVFYTSRPQRECKFIRSME